MVIGYLRWNGVLALIHGALTWVFRTCNRKHKPDRRVVSDFCERSSRELPLETTDLNRHTEENREIAAGVERSQFSDASSELNGAAAIAAGAMPYLPLKTAVVSGQLPDSTAAALASDIPALTHNKLAIPPGLRGGRPRDAMLSGDGTEAKHASSRPHILCRGGIGEWRLFVELRSPELAGARLRSFLEPLDQVEEGVFGPISDPASLVRAISADYGLKPTQNNGVILFRIAGDTAYEVVSPSVGLNMAIVPSGWHYNEERSGPPPIEAEAFDSTAYTVHYFSPQQNASVEFERKDGSELIITVARPSFRLEGEQICDIDERKGPAFAGTLPVLTGDRGALRTVVEVVIGEEGPGRGRWKNSYTVSAEDRWKIPSDFADRVGWYFIRLYDENGRLIDSQSFRYLSGVAKVEATVPGLRACKVYLKFLHSNEINIAVSHPSQRRVTNQRLSPNLESSIYEIECKPESPTGVFQISSKGNSVSLTFDIDRIWWRLDKDSLLDEDAVEQDWRADPIEVEASAFAPMSEAELLIRLPRRDPKGHAFIGFGPVTRHRLTSRTSLGIVRVALNEFSDAPELKLPGTRELGLWIGAVQSETAPILRIDVLGICNLCGKSGMSEDALLHHLIADHHQSLFEQLYLAKIDAQTSLPSAVYVCMEPGCGWSCNHSLLVNPTNMIFKHFDANHRHAKVHFTPVKDPASIRGLMSRNQQWIWKCKLGQCQGIAPLTDDPNVLYLKEAHLKASHLRELCRTW